MRRIVRTAAVCVAMVTGSAAQSMNPRTYDMGSPVVTDIWVDPARGNDGNSGESRAQAMRTLTAAWARIPQGTELTSTGYRLMLAAGAYPDSELPSYWESRYGTFAYPVILEAADGVGTALLPAMNVYDCRYLYLIGVKLTAGGGDVLHIERCRYVLVRQAILNGTGDISNNAAPDETFKGNQSSRVYVEDSDIGGAQGNALDFVGVQYGHVVGNRIHHAGDWCMYLKGGSAYFRVEGNEIYDCGTGGFTAGQGSGLEFMVAPWLHYEAENIKFINNVVHDSDGAGFGVNGGYNILFAYNTLYRVGRRSHAIEVVFGLRACDGDTATCNADLSLGAWGGVPELPEQPIPNRNVFVYDNVVYNPPGYASTWSQFSIAGPRTPASESRIPSPAVADANLQIRGNAIWNGPADMPLGVEDSEAGCRPDNATCNAIQLVQDNSINAMEVRLADPDRGNFALAAGLTLTAIAVPSFPGGDAPATPPDPVGELSNVVDRDFTGQARQGTAPGALSAGAPQRRWRR